MEIERARRYKDKTNIIIKRANQIESWVQDISSDQFLGGRLHQARNLQGLPGDSRVVHGHSHNVQGHEPGPKERL
jgi:hypothetical protein